MRAPWETAEPFLLWGCSKPQPPIKMRSSLTNVVAASLCRGAPTVSFVPAARRHSAVATAQRSKAVVTALPIS